VFFTLLDPLLAVVALSTCHTANCNSDCQSGLWNRGLRVNWRVSKG
jgi:hypothetical protein